MTIQLNRMHHEGLEMRGLLFPVWAETGEPATPGFPLFSQIMQYASQLCRQKRREEMEATLLAAAGKLVQSFCPGARIALYRVSPEAARPLPACDRPIDQGVTYRLFDDGAGEATLCLDMQFSREAPDHAISLLHSLLGVYRAHLDMLHLSMTDALTGLLNRSAFESAMPPLLARDRRQGRREPAPGRRRAGDAVPADWVGLLDLDYFKSINDRFGHAGGDEVLRSLAALLRSQFRAQDSLFRIGGEEFVVVLRQSALQDAREAFERLRRTFAQQKRENGCLATLSLGATRIKLGDDLARLMVRADQALYRAKAGGRDRVVLKT